MVVRGFHKVACSPNLSIPIDGRISQSPNVLSINAPLRTKWSSRQNDTVYKHIVTKCLIKTTHNPGFLNPFFGNSDLNKKGTLCHKEMVMKGARKCFACVKVVRLKSVL